MGKTLKNKIEEVVWGQRLRAPIVLCESYALGIGQSSKVIEQERNQLRHVLQEDECSSKVSEYKVQLRRVRLGAGRPIRKSRH